MRVDAIGLVATSAAPRDDIERRLRDHVTHDVEIIAADVDAVISRSPSVYVAIGEPALVSLVHATAEPEAPVLPVAAGEGFGSIPRSALLDAVDAILSGPRRTIDHPILSVERDGRRLGPAVADVSLITSEPARISEFSIDDGSERLDEVRADGLVVATAAGSHGYAHAAGGPLLRPETGVVAVVPIAPFRIQRQSWVVDPRSLELSVIRDEGDVELRLDDRQRTVIDPGNRVTFSIDGTLRTFSVASP